MAEFEQLLAERCGFPYCLATSNATTALLATVLSGGLEGRTIVADPSAWVGSLGTLELARVEIQIESLNTFPEATSFDSERISAVLASDEPGSRHDCSLARSFCERAGCLYIEDSDRLPGISVSEHDKSQADVQILSFGPGKPLALGEGGAMLTRDVDMFERAMKICQHPERLDRFGVLKSRRPLLNGRIHPLAALIGACILKGVVPLSP